MERAKRTPGIREAKRIAKILATTNPRRVILFGSAAVGKARAQSDVDLCVLVDSLDGLSSVRARQELYALLMARGYDFPVDVDLRVYSLTDFQERVAGGDSFLCDIVAGRVLYDRTE